MADKALLEVSGLKKYYSLRTGPMLRQPRAILRAVDGVSFNVNRGETFGLVGESGCGKSTTARLILRLTSSDGGSISYKGEDILRLKRRRMLDLRKKIQVVFQDPYASLSPRMTIGDILSEPLEIHKIGNRTQRLKKIRHYLDIVGLNPEHINRYPHEFSGGQRQRVGIARALILEPELIICDEPVSALDVSVQAQIINLMNDLQEEFMLTYLFIAHDLSVVKYISDRIGVMYLGKIVEIAGSRDLYEKPLHPYSMGLLSAIPVADPYKERARDRTILSGDVPSPIDPPSGCAFHPRCSMAQKICSREVPTLRDYGRQGTEHLVSCFFAGAHS
jgi:oligopeptide transport system ATP-binding protein